MSDVTTVLVGPNEHGVVGYGLMIARAAGTAIARYDDVASCHAAPPAGTSACHHWHFTDRLFGASVEQACDAFVDLVDRTGGRHVVTLHDVPPPAGSTRDRRRSDAYRRIGTRCDAIVVSSCHERRRLVACGTDRPVTVIPLAVASTTVTDPTTPLAAHAGRHIAVLGFIYPGKGHDTVLEACAGIPADVAVVALGRPSDGHEDLAITLHTTAAALDRRFHVTGFLPAGELAAAIDAADVPVVPARDVSASASLAAWLARGRRPLVAASEYSAELVALDEGLIVEYRPQELSTAMRRALADPASTRRSGPVPAVLRLDAVVAAHRALFRRLAP